MNYTNSITIFLFAFTVLSLNTYLLRHVFDYEREEDRKKLTGNVFVFVTIINFVMFGIELNLFPKIISAFNIKVNFHPYFLLALINNFLNVFAVIPLIIYRYKGKAINFVLINAGKALVQVLFSLILVILFNMGVLGRYYGSLIANVIFLIIYILIIYRNAILNLNLPQIKKGLLFSLPLVPSTFLHIIINVADRIILERYVTLAALGIYSVSYTLGIVLQIFAYSSYLAFEPIIFSKIGKVDFSQTVIKIRRYYLYVIFCLSFLYALFSKEILYMMASSKFSSGYKVIPIIILSTIFLSENYLFGTILIGIKKTKISLILNLIGAVINVIVNLLLIPIIGIYGAAISTLASYLVMFYLFYFYLNKHMGMKFLKINKDIVSLLVGSLLAYIFVYNFNYGINLQFILLKFLVACLYIIFISKLNKIRLSDIVYLRNYW
jgi:O-antigen/teichoic acid export membrane protein